MPANPVSAISVLQPTTAFVVFLAFWVFCVLTQAPMLLYCLSAPISDDAFVLQKVEASCGAAANAAAGTSTALNTSARTTSSFQSSSECCRKEDADQHANLRNQT